MSSSAAPLAEFVSDPPSAARINGTESRAPASRTLALRRVEPGDGAKLHALLTTALPGTLPDRGRWLRRWHWQYWENPFRGDRPAGWVLTYDEEIVGHLGAVYLPLRIAGEIRTGMIGADYAVSEQAVSVGGMFAGLKLAQTFFDAASDCVPLATTANDKTCAVFSRFGCQPVEWTREFWRAPANLAQLIRSCRGTNNRLARRVFSTAVGRASLRLAGTFCGLLRHMPALPVPRACLLETTTIELAGDLGKLADTVVQDVSTTGVHREQQYLNWRYTRHPERHNFRAITLRDLKGQALAAIVVFFEDRGIQRLAIVEDVLAPANRDDFLRCLFCAALRLATQHQADFLITTTGRQTLRHLYWELGFQSRARSAPALTLRSPKPTDTSPASPSTSAAINADVEFWHGTMF